MAYPVLGRRDEALTTAETEQFLRERLGDGVVTVLEEYGEFTVTVSTASWVEAATLVKEHDLLAYDMFDCLFGVDAREDGFDVVLVVYSTSRGRRLLLKARCDGGREHPTVPSLVEVFPGADWMERETWDMFGIEFTDHPGLAPRILCVENFEGWPLRKDFFLGSRAARPWPGVKEPAETDEEGNVVVRVPGPGEAPGPSGLDEVMAGQSKAANPGTPDDEVDAEAAESQAALDVDRADDAQVEVQLDQETYDRLIAEGKSERIARSKAKAAFVKKQRASGGETATSGEPDDDIVSETEASPEQQEAAEDPDNVPPSEADEVAAEVVEEVKDAAVRAEDARNEQVEARVARAAEQAADGPVAADDEGPTIPEGTPPEEERE